MAILWDEPALNNDGAIIDPPAAGNNSDLFKLKKIISGKIGNDGTKNVKIMVPLKYLRHVWKILEKPLINFEINLILT